MSECKHKWKKELYAGSLKCLKCDYVEFDVAGVCLSLQAKVEEMQAAIADTVTKYDFNKPFESFDRMAELKKFLPKEE